MLRPSLCMASRKQFAIKLGYCDSLEYSGTWDLVVQDVAELIG